MDVNAVHEDALVHAHRLESGGFADHGVACLGASGGGQRLGAVHGRFLVGRGQDDQRLPQFAVGELGGGFHGQCQKALHVADAEAVPVAVAFAELERIAVPAVFIERYGVRVPGQHQAAGTAAAHRDQVELAGPVRHRHALAVEAQIVQPAGQQVDDRLVGHVERRVLAGHRRPGEQFGNKLGKLGRSGHTRIIRHPVPRCIP